MTDQIANDSPYSRDTKTTLRLLAGLIDISKMNGKPIIADPKGLDFSKYSGVSILTPNLKEAALAMGMESR